MTDIVRRLGWPLQLIVGLLVVGLVIVGIAMVRADPAYHARLRHAAGLKSGDDVRVAGLHVGTVTSITTDRDQVDVTFTLDQAPDDLGVTADAAVEVKLLSILGQRFLSLTPGAGDPLADGATLDVAHAHDSYTIERFWLESTPQVEALDLDTIQQAIDVLATDLKVAPGQLKDALDGIAGVSSIVKDREQQLDALLTSIRSVTQLVLSQTDEIDDVVGNGTTVLLMVYQRRETIRALLRDARRFVGGIDTLVRRTAPQLRPALRNLRTTLRVLDQHKADLDRTLALAGPTMRVFTNAVGDGPWLGVNAPWAIMPDDWTCTLVPAEDCQ